MHFVAFGQYEGSNGLSPKGRSELASRAAAAAAPSSLVVAGGSGGFACGKGRSKVSLGKGGFSDVKGFGRRKS